MTGAVYLGNSLNLKMRRTRRAVPVMVIVGIYLSFAVWVEFAYRQNQSPERNQLLVSYTNRISKIKSINKFIFKTNQDEINLMIPLANWGVGTALIVVLQWSVSD